MVGKNGHADDSKECIPLPHCGYSLVFGPEDVTNIPYGFDSFGFPQVYEANSDEQAVAMCTAICNALSPCVGIGLYGPYADGPYTCWLYNFFFKFI